MESNRQLFDNPWLERLTHTKSQHVISLYILLSLGVMGYGFYQTSVGVIIGVLMFVCGLLVFTCLEYLVHRFVYHLGEYMNKTKWQYKFHGVHHDFPRDTDRLAMPLPAAIFFASLLFLLFRWMMGDLALFFFPGFMVGYAGYLGVHYIVHTRKPPKNRLRYLWIHHHLHHHKYDNKAFGVSSPLWDFVFGTMPPLEKK